MVRLTNDPGYDAYPDWSPDGRTICFQSSRSGDFDLYTVPAGGGTPRRLTSWSGQEGTPAYSPDGRYIAFTGNFSGNPYDEEIYVMPASGGSYVNFTKSAGYDAFPDWSPDGKYITYASTRGTFSPRVDHIWVQPYPSGQAYKITNSSYFFQQDPAWAPYGGEIAYSGQTRLGTYNFDIFRIPYRGGTPINITKTSNVKDSRPTWSPDGAYIAYDRQYPSERNVDLYFIPAGGGTPTRLTVNSAMDYGPAWSPDGKWIAFASRRDGNDEIYKLYLSGPRVEPSSFGKIKALFR